MCATRQEARKLYQERHAQGQERKMATGGKEMDAATLDQWARLAMLPKITYTTSPLPLPFATDAHTIRAHEDWAEMASAASGIEAVCLSAQMAAGVDAVPPSGVKAVSLPPAPLPQRQKPMAEEGLEKHELHVPCMPPLKHVPCMGACDDVLAVRPPLKHVPCVPPLKLSFLAEETPTPALRGVRTQWPLLGRS
jgi:hypothetical protein